MRTAFVYSKYYLTDNFSEHFDVLKLKFELAVFRLFIWIKITKQKFISSQETPSVDQKTSTI